ncbi:MAG: 4-coumarate--CoA ligase [Pseudomonadota bacterium]
MAFLDRDDVGRLTVAHIRAFQARRISEGRINPDLAYECVLAKAGEGTPTGLALDDATFGIDSLSLLDLVMGVTRYFNLADSGVEDYLFIQRRVTDWIDLIYRHFEQVGGEARLTFQTSGSSGVAKNVTKTALELKEEVTVLADEIHQCHPNAGRVISAVSPQHIYGTIWSVLLPRHLGLPVVDRYKTSPLQIARTSQTGDIILATPYLWEKFAEFGARFAPGCLGVTSGGPATIATYAAAQTVGVSALVEVFGSTETGGVGLRMAEQEDFRLLDHLQRSADLIVRGQDAVPLDLQDHLSWTGARRFKVTGRRDTVVQVAGTTVNLSEVEAAISATPGVDQVCVRPDGTRLKAFVVRAKTSVHLTERDIRSAFEHLPAVARPEKISFGPCLPVTDTGKAADW